MRLAVVRMYTHAEHGVGVGELAYAGLSNAARVGTPVSAIVETTALPSERTLDTGEVVTHVHHVFVAFGRAYATA